MEQSIQTAIAEHSNKNQDFKYFHKLAEKQWNYRNDLATLASIPPVPEFMRDLHDLVAFSRKTKLMHYKNMKFKVTGPDTFQHLK